MPPGTYERTIEFRQRMSATRKGIARDDYTESQHPFYKGDKVGYQGIHMWVRKYKTKTGICADCGEERRTQWSNVDHQYRRVLEDYTERCRPCHTTYDKERN